MLVKTVCKCYQQMKKMITTRYKVEALPGVLGNRGKGYLFEGNKGQILRGTGEQRQYWGTGNIIKQIFDFGEQEKKPIYFRGTREQVPPGRVKVYYPSIDLSS